jgi:hypothetical protein
MGGAMIISSCESKKSGQADNKAASSKNFCDDLSGASEGEMEKRKKFGYVDKSTVPENRCGSCSMYIPNEQNKECGGCLLFAGPVHASGYCIQYVAKV